MTYSTVNIKAARRPLAPHRSRSNPSLRMLAPAVDFAANSTRVTPKGAARLRHTAPTVQS